MIDKSYLTELEPGVIAVFTTIGRALYSLILFYLIPWTSIILEEEIWNEDVMDAQIEIIWFVPFVLK